MNKQEYENSIVETIHELVPNYRITNKTEISDLRQLLNDFLTQNKDSLEQTAHNKIDKILQYEKSKRVITKYDSNPSMKVYTSYVRLWRGDITKLSVDSIVNAANSIGLGCFLVGHTCIDNIIHSRAGPKLREECQMILEGRKINTGDLIITAGHNLPSRYVFHVVGPIYDQRRGIQNGVDLTKCYLNCLNTLKNKKLKSIAFCCISTGVFGYPKDEACAIAISTVTRWMSENVTYPVDVTFCVYDDTDERLYKKGLGGKL